LFANPVAVYQSCSRPLLSVQSRIPYDQLRMPATWNFDFSLGKNFAVTERYHLIFSAEMLNVFNLVNFAAPSLSLNSPTNFGVFTTQLNQPRRFLLGLKFQF
jgi:hypothetical protein